MPSKLWLVVIIHVAFVVEMSSKTAKKDCCSKSGHSKSKKEKAVQGNADKDYGNSSVNTAVNTNDILKSNRQYLI
jgi:hypothetical protein